MLNKDHVTTVEYCAHATTLLESKSVELSYFEEGARRAIVVSHPFLDPHHSDVVTEMDEFGAEGFIKGGDATPCR